VNANRIAQLALALSGITLIVVLIIAARPQPTPAQPVEPADNTAAVMAELQDLRVEIATLQQSVVDVQSLVRSVMGQGGGQGGSNQGSPAPGSPDGILPRLDRLEDSLAAVGAKLDAICGAIESSAFAPSGFACP
jgi:hypothetical protein